MADRRYRFIGQGAGIPGLPHEVTEAEAEALGTGEVLRQALAAGVYEEIRIERPQRLGRTKLANAAEESEQG